MKFETKDKLYRAGIMFAYYAIAMTLNLLVIFCAHSLIANLIYGFGLGLITGYLVQKFIMPFFTKRYEKFLDAHDNEDEELLSSVEKALDV